MFVERAVPFEYSTVTFKGLNLEVCSACQSLFSCNYFPIRGGFNHHFIILIERQDAKLLDRMTVKLNSSGLDILFPRFLVYSSVNVNEDAV